MSKRRLFHLFLLSFCLVAIHITVLAQTDFTVHWRLDSQNAGVVPLERLNKNLLTLEIFPASDRQPDVQFVCRNGETGETGASKLLSLSNRREGAGRVLQYSLATVWGSLPYPVDPSAVESKPMAIMTQRTGQSPFRMSPEHLRREFRDTVAYMLTTANHHYGLPFGDGELDCTFEVTLDGVAVQSDALVVAFGRGLPGGVFPRDLARPPLDNWPTWVVDDAFAPQLPPQPDKETVQVELGELLRLQAERSPEQVALIRYWDDGAAVSPWINVTLDSVIVHFTNPPRTSRALALVSVAMYEATVVGARISWQAQRPAPCALEPKLQPLGADCDSYSYPSEHAAVAGAASTVLAYLFPDEAERFEALAQEAVTTRLWAGAASRSDIEAGLALGRQVAEQVIARAQADGSDAVWDGQIPDFSAWQPTPPDFTPNPLEPLAGSWTTWNLDSGSELRPAAPPVPGSEQFITEAREVYEVGSSLTLEQEQIASYWEDKKGTYTPPGHWNVIARRLICQQGLSTPQAALIYATLNTAQADAFIAAWDAKYAYWSVRPVTAIRDRFDPEWWPYIITPPFPSYVSGHATTSGAASVVLAHFFPAQAEQLNGLAQQAAISRLYGGIHFASDNEVGLALGQAVAKKALARVARTS